MSPVVAGSGETFMPAVKPQWGLAMLGRSPAQQEAVDAGVPAARSAGSGKGGARPACN
jgi:hypothetical protein